MGEISLGNSDHKLGYLYETIKLLYLLHIRLRAITLEIEEGSDPSPISYNHKISLTVLKAYFLIHMDITLSYKTARCIT